MPEHTQKIDRLLTTEEAASRVRLSPKTLEKLRVVGGGPRFKKLAGAVRYKEEDLAAWIEACTRTSTSDHGAVSAE
jgi:predicted DNA-binding transcriptional regulator AlpA